MEEAESTFQVTSLRGGGNEFRSYSFGSHVYSDHIDLSNGSSNSAPLQAANAPPDDFLEVSRLMVQLVSEKITLNALDTEAFVSCVWSLAQYVQLHRVAGRKESEALVPPEMLHQLLAQAPKTIYSSSSGGEDQNKYLLPTLMESVLYLLPTVGVSHYSGAAGGRRGTDAGGADEEECAFPFPEGPRSGRANQKSARAMPKSGSPFQPVVASNPFVPSSGKTYRNQNWQRSEVYDPKMLLETIRNAIYRRAQTMPMGPLNKSLLALDRIEEAVISAHGGAPPPAPADDHLSRHHDRGGQPPATRTQQANFLDPHLAEMVAEILPTKLEHMRREHVLELLTQSSSGVEQLQARVRPQIAPAILKALAAEYQFLVDDMVLVAEVLAAADVHGFEDVAAERGAAKTVGGRKTPAPWSATDDHEQEIFADLRLAGLAGRHARAAALAREARDAFDARILAVHEQCERRGPVLIGGRGGDEEPWPSSSTWGKIEIPPHVRFAILENSRAYRHRHVAEDFLPDAIALACIQFSAHVRFDAWRTKYLCLESTSVILLPALFAVLPNSVKLVARIYAVTK